MRLKRLEILGFKSFAEKTTFVFEPGVTGIIGPNGAGKSNVVDAIKWVMGETRPTSLRGSEMQDVLFKGSDGKAPAGFAQVTLVLDNEDGFLPGRGPEVSIGRRLFKTGESEYLVDRQVVRRKDLKELLLDTGLGVGAYSVMEQGKIDAVLSANPEERRRIFEEASGISRFKLRRKEAVRKLERTEQNLLRLGDLLEEKQKRLRSLKIQAGRARRYKELLRRLRDLRVALGLEDVREARELSLRVEAESGEKEAALGAVQEALEELLRREEEIRAEEDRLEEEQEVLNASLSEVRSREEGCRERIRGLEQKKVSLEERVREAGDQRKRILDSRKRQEEEYFRAREKAQQVAAFLEEAERRLASARSAHAEWAAKRREALEERQAAESASLELLHEIARAGNRVSDAEARLRAMEEGIAKIQARSRELEESLQELSRRIRALQEEEKAAARGEQEAAEALREAQAELEAARERRRELQAREQEIREALSALDSRAQVLRDLESSLAGMAEGPRKLLESGAPGLLGRTVDFLDCPGEYARALEAALGEKVHSLVVEGLGPARSLLERVYAENLGRVHLVLADPPGPADSEPARELPPLPEHAGVLGWLLPRVEAKEGFRRRAWDLLGRVLLVEDVEAGIVLSGLEKGLVCVTPSGDRMEGGCKVSGGPTDVGASPIQRRSELRDLERRISALESEQEENARLLEETREQASRAEERAKVSSRLQEEARKELRRIGGELLRLEERTAVASREREVLRSEEEQSRRAREEIRAELEAARAALEEFRRKGKEADRVLAEARRKVEEITRFKEEAFQKESQAKVEVARARSELEGLQARLQVLGRSVQENGLRVEELRSEAERAREEMEKTSREIAALEEEGRSLLERRAGLEERLAALQEKRAALRKEAQALEERIGAAREERESLKSALERLSFEAREARARVELVRRRLLEEHDVDLDWFLEEPVYGPPLPPGTDAEGRPIYGPPLPEDWRYPEEDVERLWEREDFDPAQARREVSRVKASMDRIGAVNLRAVEELAQEQEAVERLAAEAEDLRKGRKALQEMIERINAESTRLFLETFQEARRNFQEMFRRLFQGGKADIRLQEGADPLEAGIEIIARPPGKQPQNINLLSGGERSLVALAILFAVFKVKPSPFAVLDEVDAALDDSNVGRFLQILKDFVKNTQFLLVTHNKRSMAAAEVLYGITMQKKGVSSCVSVRIEDVRSGGEVEIGAPSARPVRRGGEEKAAEAGA